MSEQDERRPAPANPYAKHKEWGDDISRERNKGLFKRILTAGVGRDKPVDGSKVEVHYVGRLLDGTVFDSSRDRGDTFEFVLGNKSVIKGWEEGVKTMIKGEKSLLTCKPEYAYGEKGSPPKIPSNATLQFEIELIQWKGEDVTPNKDGGVRRRLLRQENKADYYLPKDGAEVEVHVIGKYKGKVFEDRDVKFVLGEGSENNVIDGLEVAIRHMRRAQAYHLDILPKYAYGDKGHAEFGIPPGAELEYELELKRFEKLKEPWDYENIQERIAEADHIKQRGTMFFKENKFELALKVYNRAFGVVEGTHIHKDEDKEACKDIRIVLHLNMALCHLKLDNGLEARGECDKVLELDEKNIKALFRRGQAYMVMQEYTEAVKAFEECLKVDPKNKAAKTQMSISKEKLKAFKASEKRRYVKMFEKLSEELNKDRKDEPEEMETDHTTESSSSGDEETEKRDRGPVESVPAEEGTNDPNTEQNRIVQEPSEDGNGPVSEQEPTTQEPTAESDETSVQQDTTEGSKEEEQKKEPKEEATEEEPKKEEPKEEEPKEEEPKEEEPKEEEPMEKD